MRNERYYYSMMQPEEKRIYRLIYDGLKAREEQIPVQTPFFPELVEEVYLRVLYDNPLFFHVNQTMIQMMGQPGFYVLLPQYLYSMAEIQAVTREIRQVVNRVGEKARTMLSNEFRLEKYLHDCVVKSVAYDYDSLKKKDCWNAHSIVGAFLEKRAVCEGIAKAFKLLCNEYEIKCIIVLGQADPDQHYTDDSYHAWNLVKIQGESYHVDPTWDNLFDRGIGHISYDYFNVTTEAILKDHLPIGTLPECTATRLNYFHATGSIVRSFNELALLIEKRIHTGKIMFQADDSQGEFQTSDELYQKTTMALDWIYQKLRLDRPCALAFNEAQKIGKIFFRS